MNNKEWVLVARLLLAPPGVLLVLLLINKLKKRKRL